MQSMLQTKAISHPKQPYALYLQHIGFVLKQMPVFKAKVVVPQREEREQD